MTIFRLPDLGEGLAEAELVAWHVGPGDRVVADQPLVSVETAKAVVEIPSPWSGRVVATFGAPGDVLKIGAVLAEIETESRTEDRGSVVGALPVEAPVAAGGSAPTAPVPERRSGPRAVSPAVRRRAAELGVDVSTVAGTGPDGTITLADVEAARAMAVRPPAPYQPLTGVRRAMAEALSREAARVVSATVTDEVPVEHWPAGTDPTIRLIRAVVAGCRAAPELNAWLDMSRKARCLHERIDLGIAMETGDGLFVPTLRNVAALSERDLRASLDALKSAVRTRTVPQGDLTGQTITLSNFGTIGGLHAALTIMPPQVAILGAGRIHQAVRPTASGMAVVRVLPLSLTFDHRAVTGAEAIRFLSAAIADLAA